MSEKWFFLIFLYMLIFFCKPRINLFNLVSFGCVDFYAKISLILYLPLENSTTCTAIVCMSRPICVPVCELQVAFCVG